MPRKSEVWIVDLGMAKKARPVLILSGPCGGADRDLITVIPHTTQLRGARFEVVIDLPFLRPGAFLAPNPATLSTRRADKYLGRLSDVQVLQIEQRLLEWLLIDPAAHLLAPQRPG